MLKSLKIHNIALISDCEIEFYNGLNVLSGETGAGKSVILDSINFVLGQKADKTMIRRGETECYATCVFDISDSEKAKLALNEENIEFEDEIIIKRSFNENGKGSIKLNGEPVTSGMLRKITKHLVDVHGQSDHFALLKESEQLELIDRLGENEVIIVKSEISKLVEQINSVQADLNKLGGSNEDRAKKLDYLDFSIKEIENANLYETEEEELVLKRKKLQNIEKIMTSASTSYEAISGECGALDALSLAYRNLSQIENFDDEYREMSSSLNDCVSILQDVASKLNETLEGEFNIAEIDEVEKRIEYISLLKNKYGKNYQEIMTCLENYKNEYELISQSSEQSEKLKIKLSALFVDLKKNYKALTIIRKRVSNELSEKLVDRLKELAMKNANFSVDFVSDYDSEKVFINGVDDVAFMFSANLGEPLKPLSKVISGGELSRLMLAVKSVTANVSDAHTYIFDEIDSGISGIAASVVAENFARISLDRQIIAISHLPQIVAMSDSSMFIKKTEDDERTSTNVFALSKADKIMEVVRLIGGDETSESAVKHAEEMIEKAIVFKSKLN